MKNGWVNDEQGRAMSKSRGTGIGAREAMEQVGRRRAAPVGRLGRVRSTTCASARTSSSRSAASTATCAIACASCSRTSTISAGRRRRARGDGADRPARVPRRRRVRRRRQERVRPLRDSRRLSARRRVRERDVEPLLRRAQGSALLARGRRSAPAQRAIGAALRADALPHGARAGALVHGRRGVAGVAARRCAATPRASSIRRSTWRAIEAARFESDLRLWESLRALRARVAASASPRDFEAQLRLTVTPCAYKRLAALGDNLREALVVSQLTWPSERRRTATASSRSSSSPAEGEKCARCWKYRELGTDPAHPAICADCAQVVACSKPASNSRSAPSRNVAHAPLRSRRARRASAR